MFRLGVLILLTMVTAAATPAPAFPQAQQAPPAPPPLPVLGVPPGYRYESQGRRDPFVNPVPRPAGSAAAVPVVRPPGLRGVLVSEANLIGISSSKEDPSMSRAIIAAPGNRTYFASVGDTLFDAVVKEIQPDAVVFAMGTPGNTEGQPQQTAVNREVIKRVR
jgi:hypothetical protein